MKQFAVAVVAALALPACIPVAIGAGVAGAYYYNSADRVYVDENPPEIIEAALRVVTDLGLTVLGSSSSGLDGEVLAETARGDKVQIVAEREQEGRSKLIVRVGRVDEDRAHEIAELILAELGRE